MALSSPTVDVLIVGGGYAGLSAAFTLYRALHTCIIFDAHRPRNLHNTSIRLTPQWEGENPEIVRERTRKELSKPGLVQFIDADIKNLEKINDGLFKVTSDSEQHWLGRRLLLATGAVDIFPDIKGYEDCYTRGM